MTLTLLPHPYVPPFNIELFECGYWDSIDVIDDYFSALYIASMHVQEIPINEKCVRVMDGNNKVI